MNKKTAILMASCLMAFGIEHANSQTINDKTMEVKNQNTVINNELREMYVKYVAAANAHDFDAISKMVADDVIVNGENKKREDVIGGFRALLNAMPDLSWDLQHLVVEEDRISARLHDKGTPTENSFFGANPKNLTVQFSEFGSYKVRDGLFVEMWYIIDAPSVVEQLAQ